MIGYEIKFIFLKFRVQCLTHPNSPSGFPVSVAIRLSNLIGGSVLFAIDLYPFHLYLLHRLEISVYSCLFFDVVKLIKKVIQSTTSCYLFEIWNFVFFFAFYGLPRASLIRLFEVWIFITNGFSFPVAWGHEAHIAKFCLYFWWPHRIEVSVYSLVPLFRSIR